MTPFVGSDKYWLWLKIKLEGLRRFWSMFPLTRVPFWYRFFEPQLNIENVPGQSGEVIGLFSFHQATALVSY